MDISRKTINVLFDKNLLYLFMDNGEIYYFNKEKFDYVPFKYNDKIANAVEYLYNYTEIGIDLPRNKKKLWFEDYPAQVMALDSDRIIIDYRTKHGNNLEPKDKVEQIMAVGEAIKLPKENDDHLINLITSIMAVIKQYKDSNQYKIYNKNDLPNIVSQIKGLNNKFLSEDEQDMIEFRKILGVK